MACIAKRRGRYVIDVYDQHGKRYRKTMKAGATKDDARKELREIEAKIERRTFIHEKKTPLFSEVKADWLKHKKQYLRETTGEMYQNILQRHYDYFNEMRINQITTATVEKFITELQIRGKGIRGKRRPDAIPKPDGKKISLSTMRRILVCLNQIMAYAVRHRFIDYNPCRDAERPRNQGNEADQAKGISILTPGQIRKFIEAVTDQKHRTLFLTAIMTGARQGEILGLKWMDVDFTKKQVSITRTFNKGRFFTPKTKGSARRIDLAPMLVRELAAWKLKSGGQDEGLVFPNEAEEPGPMNSSNMMNRHFFKALKKAEVQRIRFHDLRHTYASLLLMQGENVKYVQTQLGHSSPTVTLNVYAHLMKDENQEAVCRLENTIFEGTGHNLVTETEKGQASNG